MLLSLVPLRHDEVVIRTIRRHWLRVVVEAVGLGFVFFLTVLIVLFGEVVIYALPESSVGKGVAGLLGVYVVSLVGLLLWMRFFAVWSDHWLDVWIITNKRIIDVEQKGFFVREVASFPLDRIQDVTYEVVGIVSTWLNFGNVRIQTASISDDFIMKQVPHPSDVKDALMEALTKRLGERSEDRPVGMAEGTPV